MKIKFRSPITWFYLILIGYSCYDYVEHISRPGSIFSEHPGPWLLFTVFSIATILAIFHFVNLGLASLFKKKWLIFEIIALGVAICCHILFSGPLYNQWLWPYNQLNFFFKFGPVLILLSIYFAFRMIWFLFSTVVKKKLSKTSRTS